LFVALPLVPEIPPEIVVYDRPSRCPYLEERTARLPLRLPVRRLTRKELDERLHQGDRRQGLLFYRTACPSCTACEPIRIDVREFVLSRTQRRILARGDRELDTSVGPTIVDRRRVDLYNLHKHGRGLGDGQADIDVEGYREFLVETSCESFELRYRMGDELIGVAITDRGRNSLSAVYCHFDPALSSLSIGTYSILKQIEMCRRYRLSYLYLGLYIADSPRMVYKARFHPHQRLIDGQWRTFSR
jgi:arginine-tRNA-protein transferase